MFLSSASIKRPVAMTTLIIALTVFGVLAFRSIGVDLAPSVSVPYITVLAVYPGASPDEIETTVARRLEDAVVQVDGLKHVTTTCMNNFCQILLEFEMNRDVDVCATDVRDKIALVRSDLPDSVEDPKTLKYDVNATPVVTVAVTGSLTTEEMYDYADNVLADRFSRLAGVASVEKIGGMKREVMIEIDRDKLAARGLAAAQIVQAVARENAKVPIGQIDDGVREISLMFDAEAAKISDLGDIELGVVRGERVYLRDVASFHFGTERTKSIAFFDGKPCVILKVTKKGEANAVAVVGRVKKVFDELQKQLPGGLKLEWFRDDAGFIQAQVDDGLTNLWQGILLTGFILLLFLGDVRTAFIAFVSIPVTMVISLITFTWFDYTMNAVTMSAFGISVGVLVTNSIVVLESISGAFSKKTSDPVGMTVERAVSAVGLAVAASALTNVVVFLPIANMKSMTGKFIAPFGVTVAAATFASLLISFTLTPILAKGAFAYGGNQRQTLLQKILTPWTRFYTALSRGYLRSVGLLLKAPRFGLLVMTAAAVVGLWFTLTRVETDFIPKIDQGDIVVNLEFPADYNLTHTAERANALAAKIRRDPAVRHAVVQAGKVQGMVGKASEGSYLAEIDVRLPDKTVRPPDCSIEQVSARLNVLLKHEPDCVSAVLTPLVVGGTGQQIQVNVMGEDLDTLASIGTAVTRDLKASGSAAEIQNSVRPGRPEVRFRPNRAVLHDLDIPSSAVGISLRTAIAGVKRTTYKAGDRAYDVRIRYEQKDGRDQLDALNLPGPDGRPIPLTAVTQSRERLQPTQILRYEKTREVVVYADPAPGVGLSTTLAQIRGILARRLPSGYTSGFSGMAELMGEAVSEFVLVMVIALILTYLLLAAVLESWTQPLIILLTVPFSYLGLYLALWITGQKASIFSLLAGVMLIGIVVNAAILLIDRANTLRAKSGILPRQAFLLAARSEFRPILMSCVAALVGMLPMAFGSGLGSEIRSGIGVGSVGGIFVSSFLSLYFIPAFYVVAVRRRRPTRPAPSSVPVVRAVLLVAVCGFALTGCQTPDIGERLDSATEMSTRLRSDTTSFLATNPAPLTLARALDLARERSLKLTSQQLDLNLAGVRKGLAFSSFLPQVNAAYQRQDADRPLRTTPVRLGPLGSMSMNLGDYVSESQLTITQPLFTPNAWLLFVEARNLEKAQTYRLARARELLDVQVTALFYSAAVSAELVKTYTAQTNASEALAARVANLTGEGYALVPDRERLLARCANDRFELTRADHRAALARARLADILRFWPGDTRLAVDGASMTNVLSRPWRLADVSGSPTNVPAAAARDLPCEELLFQALVNRRDLWAGDQLIQVRKTEIWRALTEWLPELAVTGSGHYTKTPMLATTQYWSGGLMGAMSLFKGFQSVNDYRRARAERTAEYELQEDRMLATAVAVVEARQNLTEAQTARGVAAQALRAAEMDYRAAQNRYEQDQETLSNVLDKLTALESARVTDATAAYADALAEIVLRDAVGAGIGVPAPKTASETDFPEE